MTHFLRLSAACSVSCKRTRRSQNLAADVHTRRSRARNVKGQSKQLPKQRQQNTLAFSHFPLALVAHGTRDVFHMETTGTDPRTAHFLSKYPLSTPDLTQYCYGSTWCFGAGFWFWDILILSFLTSASAFLSCFSNPRGARAFGAIVSHGATPKPSTLPPFSIQVSPTRWSKQNSRTGATLRRHFLRAVAAAVFYVLSLRRLRLRVAAQACRTSHCRCFCNSRR